jgi:hypothetical protein
MITKSVSTELDIGSSVRKVMGKMAQLLPDWSIDREIGRLLDFHSLAATGISAAQGEPELLRALQDVQRGREGSPSEDEWTRRIEEADKKFAVAKQHLDLGFSYLYELMLVKFWSILEAGIEEIAVECLKRPDECKDTNLLRSLKGPLLEFASASLDQRAEFLYSEIKVATKSALKVGVGVFEAVLEPLGMAGSVDDLTRRLLLELQQKRHVFVHRRGIADKRFIEACPFLDCTIGQPIVVDRPSVWRFGIAVGLYNFELQKRNFARAGLPIPDSLEVHRRTLVESIERNYPPLA